MTLSWRICHSGLGFNLQDGVTLSWRICHSGSTSINEVCSEQGRIIPSSLWTRIRLGLLLFSLQTTNSSQIIIVILCKTVKYLWPNVDLAFYRSHSKVTVFTDWNTSSRDAKAPEIIGGPSPPQKYWRTSSPRPLWSTPKLMAMNYEANMLYSGHEADDNPNQ